MCFKIKTPSVAPVSMTARDLVPETEAKEPESPAFGDSGDTFANRKGRDALKIKRNDSAGYNPVNM